jgi:putative nucleotidyltransferase with HDIG domain
MKPHLPLFNGGGKKNSEKNSQSLNVDWKRIGLAAATVIILSVLLSIHMLPSKVTLRLYDPAPENIYAQRTVRYEDVAETERRKDLAAQSAGKVYDPIPSAMDQAIGGLRIVFKALEEERLRYGLAATPEQVIRVREKVAPLLGARASDRTITTLLQADANGFSEIKDHALSILSSAMSKEIREDPQDLGAVRTSVASQAERLIGRGRESWAVTQVVQALVRPNQAYNQGRTVARQERARDSVRPAYGLVMRGELVIGKGERVLGEHIAKFEALGLRNPKLDYRSVASLTLFVLGVVLLVTAYMKRYHPAVFASPLTLSLLAFLVILSTFALRVGGSMLGIKLSPEQVGYLGVLWVVTTGMFITVLVDQQVAVLIAAILSVVLSMLLNNELRYAASSLLTSLVGIYSVASIRDRNDSIRAFGMLAVTGVLLVWVMGGINNDPLSAMLVGSVWATGIAMGATWLFWLGTWLLERPFGRTTHISLLELADTNRPLLRQLSLEAGGTFNHSMTVGYLAETAAENIGADPLLARVAAYYHDIGKIRRPQFFIENQSVENVHDRMNPTLSTLVITSHIKDGLDIAKEHKLPKIVLDVVAQHHGTSLVQYFYNQFADELDPSMAVEQQFRYPGPKPQTKEAAIVMLADSVEAASRALSKPTPAKIELVVNKVIGEKLRDGQLDECQLTFQELSAITGSFVKALMGTMHARIEYPEAATTEGKKIAANGNSDSEPAKASGQSSANEESDQAITAG